MDPEQVYIIIHPHYIKDGSAVAWTLEPGSLTETEIEQLLAETGVFHLSGNG